MTDPVVYGPAFSTYVRSVRLALEEKGVGYRLEQIDIFKDAHKTPEFLARHPFGKVPAFEHDGFALFETSAILRYVDEAFDGPALQPAEVHQRARMAQAIGIIDSYGYPAIISQIVIQRLVVPLLGGATDEAAVGAGVPQAKATVGALEAILDGGQCLAGDTLSLADLHLAPIYDYFSQTPEGETLLGPAANLRRWWSSMSGRPSVVKTKPSLG